MRIILAISFMFILAGCTSSVQPIEYGNDECYFCSMSIVEKQYGTELISDKGKVRKFDAIECMVNFIHENPDLEIAKLYVNTYDKPGELMDVNSCAYLISKSLPSPMGANLTAFSTNEKAIEMLNLNEGKVYSWSEVLHLKNL